MVWIDTRLGIIKKKDETKEIEMQSNKLLSFFLVLIIVLAVFMLNMTFAGKIPGTVLMVIRMILIALFFTTWRLFHRKKETHAKNLAFTLMVVNLAFFTVSFFTTDLWNLNLESAKGIALAKLSDGFIISLVLIFSFLIGGFQQIIEKRWLLVLIQARGKHSIMIVMATGLEYVQEFVSVINGY